MTEVVVTGAGGFLGRNLQVRLDEIDGCSVRTITRVDDEKSIPAKLAGADIVYHLAGVNRPERIEEFYEVNHGLTARIVKYLESLEETPTVVYSSSTRATAGDHYGRSKRAGEEELVEYAQTQGARVVIYRLTNIFGKWSRPNYNSVVATFCHNITRDEPIEVHDEETVIDLVYVDDVVEHFVSHLGEGRNPGVVRPSVEPVYSITLGKLAEQLRRFRGIRSTLQVPDLSDRFTRVLYSTYLSYLPEDQFSYDLDEREDERGKLAELLKSEYSGQVFVSTTKPGITRGEHYHHTKVEKFCVLSGQGVVRFRRLMNSEVIEYQVSGERFEVVDIPPGYTHNIENVGSEKMVVLFWADKIFDPEDPDTTYMPVEP